MTYLGCLPTPLVWTHTPSCRPPVRVRVCIIKAGVTERLKTLLLLGLRLSERQPSEVKTKAERNDLAERWPGAAEHTGAILHRGLFKELQGGCKDARMVTVYTPGCLYFVLMCVGHSIGILFA